METVAPEAGRRQDLQDSGPLWTGVRVGVGGQPSDDSQVLHVGSWPQDRAAGVV